VKMAEHIAPHIRKMFENVDNLEIENKDVVSGLISSEGETLKFRSRTSFRSDELEEWLNTMTDYMKESIRGYITKAI